jgi:hypothetical protein
MMRKILYLLVVIFAYALGWYSYRSNMTIFHDINNEGEAAGYYYHSVFESKYTWNYLPFGNQK